MRAPGRFRGTIEDIRNWLIRNPVDDFDCTIITTYPGTPYYEVAELHPEQAAVWTDTHPKTGDRLHSIEVDYTTCADYYKGDLNGGYRAIVFTDHLGSEQVTGACATPLNATGVRRYVSRSTPGAAALGYEHSMGQGASRLYSSIGKIQQIDEKSPRDARLLSA